NGIPAFPQAEMILPQLGSLPNMAVLTSEELDMERISLRAIFSDRAFVTRYSINLEAPSPSETINLARWIKSSKSLSLNNPYPGSSLDITFLLPARPLAMTATISLVEVSPSTVIMLKDLSTQYLSVSCSRFSSMAKSVTTQASMVAILGWIIPEPLATPPRFTVSPSATKSTNRSLAKVSVVRIAFATKEPALV